MFSFLIGISETHTCSKLTWKYHSFPGPLLHFFSRGRATLYHSYWSLFLVFQSRILETSLRVKEGCVFPICPSLPGSQQGAPLGFQELADQTSHPSPLSQRKLQDKCARQALCSVQKMLVWSRSMQFRNLQRKELGSLEPTECECVPGKLALPTSHCCFLLSPHFLRSPPSSAVFPHVSVSHPFFCVYDFSGCKCFLTSRT